MDRLIRTLQGEDYRARVEAAKALGEIGDPRALGPLTQGLRDLSPDVQVAAEEALQKIKDANR